MSPSTGPATGGPAPVSYRFDDIVVDVAAHTLSRGGEPQTVEPKAFVVLQLLLGRAGELVPRDELLDTVWGHRHVTPGVLTRVIAQLRQALADDSHHPRYIQTQHALGYRFIGRLEGVGGSSDAAFALSSDAGRSGDGAVDGEAGSGSLPGADVASASGTISPAARAPGTAPAAAPGPGSRRRRAGDTQPTTTPLARRERRRFPRGRRWAWTLPVIGLLLAVAGWWLLQQRNAPPRAAEASVAVLPFTTLSDDKTDRYFAEGLAAEMHSALAGVHGLKVAAWMPPSARIAGEDVKALGQRLGVATVLDASVRRAGERVRISARLADTRSGYTLWSRTYERALADVFATQSDIAQEVATALVGVMPDAGEGLRRRLQPTRNVAAFDAYLRGVQALLQVGKEKEAAAGHFKRALEKDSGFARAQAGLCNAELWRFEYTRNVDAFEGARLACLRAGNMDPGNGTVRLALGNLHFAQGDVDKAWKLYAELKSDLEVRSDALVRMAKVAEAKGRHDEAVQFLKEAIAHSPGNGYVVASMGYLQAGAGRMQEAIASYRRAIELNPGNANYWSAYGSLLLRVGANDEAERAMRRSLAIEPRASVLNNLGTLRYQAGDYAEAVRFYRRATELDPGHFLMLGYLGDGLLADPQTAPEAAAVFRRAAGLAGRYVAMKPQDGEALAALGWYRANLGDASGALEMVQQSERFAMSNRGEVALFNAQTLAQLGTIESAKKWVQVARAEGIPESRIGTNAVLVRKRVVVARQANSSTP